MNLIFLGAPGAGKGTQAEAVCKKYSIPAISTGNILREAVKSGTDLGIKAKAFMDAGDLVPDGLLIGLIEDRLQQKDCEKGFVLDGFPRTIPQAEALDKMDVKLDLIIDIEVSDARIIARMSGRRVCGNCGSSYHLEYKNPKVEGVCNECAGTLIQRKDDHEETVKERLKVYHDQTEPLKEYYSKQGKLAVVHGQEKIENTTAYVFKTIGDFE